MSPEQLAFTRIGGNVHRDSDRAEFSVTPGAPDTVAPPPPPPAAAAAAPAGAGASAAAVDAEVARRVNEWKVRLRALNVYMDTIPQSRADEEERRVRAEVEAAMAPAAAAAARQLPPPQQQQLLLQQLQDRLRREGERAVVEAGAGEANLRFYRGELKIGRGYAVQDFWRAAPDGLRGNYALLESMHDYIQWLFPSPQASLYNACAQPLTKEEAGAFAADPLLQGRVVDSYDTFLDFLGLELDGRDPGRVRRAAHFGARSYNWAHGEWNHNWQRVTRMLTCLGATGLGRLQRPFVEFVIRDMDAGRSLAPSFRDSLRHHWVEAVCSDADRAELRALLPAA